MVHYSVLVPVHDATSAVARLLALLGEALDRLILPYELIGIVDAAAPQSADVLDQWMDQHSRLRILRFDRSRGISAIVRAGVAASRGELILAVSPDSDIAVDHLAHLISRLGRYDFAFAERERTIGEYFRDGAARVLRFSAGGRGVGAGDKLFFAARRRSLAGLELAGSAIRVLPELVERRGFRVCRVTIAQGLPPRGRRLRPNIFRRSAARWHARRFAPHLAREQWPSDTVDELPILARAERRERHPTGASSALPAHHEPGEPG